MQVGDEIDTITKGPLGLTDFIAFIAGGAAPIPRVAAHSVSLKRYHKHPKWAFRDPRTHALEPVYSVHYNDYAAKLQGAQIAYDVGIQRTCWQIHSLTNWMGDAGVLKSITGQYRAHVYLGDVVRLGGRVDAKEVDANGDHVVRLTTWARNQRGQEVMPGTAVIALPVRGGTADRTDSPAAESDSDRSMSSRQPAGATRSPLRSSTACPTACTPSARAGWKTCSRSPTAGVRGRTSSRAIASSRSTTCTRPFWPRSRELQDLGVKRGDRVFILGWNSPEWVVNFWACLCAGAVPVLANTWWSAAEVAKGLAALQPALTLADAPAAAKMPAGSRCGPWAITAAHQPDSDAPGEDNGTGTRKRPPSSSSPRARRASRRPSSCRIAPCWPACT